MESNLRVLFIDAQTGFYKIKKYKIGDFFGPVDLGLHLAGKYKSLNIGTGLLAGSIFPGSNRLIVNGFSPCWGGFYISSMGGAGLVFSNLGINLIAIVNKSPVPVSIYLNRMNGEEIQIECLPVDLNQIWSDGRKGIYSLMDYTYKAFADRYSTDPRILATGPASMHTDFGAIASVPVSKGNLSFVDTWAGRGGFGTKLLQDHGIASIIYGGTFIDEDFRDRKVADEWFEDRFNKKLAAKDLEATTKYRYDPTFNTGGTFGVNYSSVGGKLMAFNYKSIYMQETERVDIHKKFVIDHYLKQFNEETIDKKQQKTCGEPCVAVCKKMNNEFKKDYEPYQTMGPLCGIFDQRAAEKLNHHADMLGFDGISAGGVLSWLMDCMNDNLISKEELGVTKQPKFTQENFDLVNDSMNNADLGIEMLDSIINKRGIVDLTEGARKFARKIARLKGKQVFDKFVFTSYARKGWMVPNQYWNAGVLSPMPIMGKYYMHYSNDFVPPRELGRKNAERMIKELVLDNAGFCRFHRGWAEDMIPEIIGSLYGLKNEFLIKISATASRINSRNSSVFWESERDIDFVLTFLKRKRDVEGDKNPDLQKWINEFEKDKNEAALNFWYEIHKGVHESLREFH
jgi:glyceraldehyde-3-phosphate dehydrogenase (ferredoxin)